MVETLPQNEGRFWGFEITGKVSWEDEKTWIGFVEKEIEKYGKVNVLVVLGEQAGWGMKAGIEDIQWIMKHTKKFDKIAIVSDRKVEKWLVTVDSAFAKRVDIREKHFDTSELAAAWEWLKA